MTESDKFILREAGTVTIGVDGGREQVITWLLSALGDRLFVVGPVLDDDRCWVFNIQNNNENIHSFDGVILEGMVLFWLLPQ